MQHTGKLSAKNSSDLKNLKEELQCLKICLLVAKFVFALRSVSHPILSSVRQHENAFESQCRSLT